MIKRIITRRQKRKEARERDRAFALVAAELVARDPSLCDLPHEELIDRMHDAMALTLKGLARLGASVDECGVTFIRFGEVLQRLEANVRVDKIVAGAEPYPIKARSPDHVAALGPCTRCGGVLDSGSFQRVCGPCHDSAPVDPRGSRRTA